MARPRVVVDDRFRLFEADLDRAVERGLGKAAAVGVAAARTTPSRYRIQSITGKVRGSSVRKTAKGYEVEIVSPDFRSVFFLFGTYQRRKKKMAQARRSQSGNVGVRPVRFLQRGRREAAKRLVDFISREVRTR